MDSQVGSSEAGKLVVESELGWQIGQDTPSGEVEQYLQDIFGSKELIHNYDVHAKMCIRDRP